MSYVKSNNVFFSEGLAYRFHPFFKKILATLKNTKLQDVLSIKGSFGNDALGGKKFFGFRFKRRKKTKRPGIKKDVLNNLYRGVYTPDEPSDFFKKRISIFKKLKVKLNQTNRYFL